MITPITPPLIDKPEIVVPDAAPLIHLAQAGLLHLLHEVGAAVVVVDMVAHEVTRDLSKAGASILRDWIEAGRQPGSNQPVRVEDASTRPSSKRARTTSCATVAKRRSWSGWPRRLRAPIRP
jgi:hypothetical protein